VEPLERGEDRYVQSQDGNDSATINVYTPQSWTN
jgi:hypothetical protein